MNRKDWPLRALYFAKQALYPVHLQKIMFLMSKAEVDLGGDFYTFKNWDYGPFAQTIYDDMEALEEDGMVRVLPGRTRAYELTHAGVQAGETAVTDIGSEAAQQLDQIVDWAKRLSFAQLVSAIYEKHPETKERSIFNK